MKGGRSHKKKRTALSRLFSFPRLFSRSFCFFLLFAFSAVFSLSFLLASWASEEIPPLHAIFHRLPENSRAALLSLGTSDYPNFSSVFSSFSSSGVFDVSDEFSGALGLSQDRLAIALVEYFAGLFERRPHWASSLLGSSAFSSFSSSAQSTAALAIFYCANPECRQVQKAFGHISPILRKPREPLLVDFPPSSSLLVQLWARFLGSGNPAYVERLVDFLLIDLNEELRGDNRLSLSEQRLFVAVVDSLIFYTFSSPEVLSIFKKFDSWREKNKGIQIIWEEMEKRKNNEKQTEK